MTIKHPSIVNCVLNSILGITLTIGISSIPKSNAQAQATNFDNFFDWCNQKDNISTEAKRTVEAILVKVGTDDCSQATQIVSLTTRLNLISRQISDVKPIASLPNLTRLVLHNNQISDITPLASLGKLEKLYLARNRISDITPIKSLTKLQELILSSNQVSNISPLSSLTNLNKLFLLSNQIS